MATHARALALRIPGTGKPGWAAVYGVAQSRTRPMRRSSSIVCSSQMAIKGWLGKQKWYTHDILNGVCLGKDQQTWEPGQQCWVKCARYTRRAPAHTHVLLLHLYTMSRRNHYRETQSRSGVAQCWGWGDSVSFWWTVLTGTVVMPTPLSTPSQCTEAWNACTAHSAVTSQLLPPNQINFWCFPASFPM